MNNRFIEELQYLEGFSTFCYQNCIMNIWKMWGVKYPQIYINCSLKFNIKIKDDGRIKYEHDLESRGTLPLYSDLVKRKYEKEKTAYDVFLSNVSYIEKQKRPIIVGVDTYYLEYCTNYEKNHAAHTLILEGYDCKKHNVKVIDWYYPWFYVGEIKLTKFLQARKSKNEYDGTRFSGVSIDNNWAKVLPVGTENDTRELIKQQLALSLKQYYLSDSLSKGLKALEFVVNRLSKERFKDERLYEDISDIFFQLKCNISLFMEAIKVCKERYSNSYVDSLLDSYMVEIRELDVLNLNFLKMKVLNKKEVNPQIVHVANHILDMEKRNYEIINMIYEHI